jgi:hypothetical protein
MKRIMAGSAGLSVGVQVATLPFKDELCLNLSNQLFKASAEASDAPEVTNTS